MTDPDSPDAWAEIEAKEVRLWLSEPITGLWCPTCLLPSGYKFSISRDPAEVSESFTWRCSEDNTHRLPEEAS